MLRPPLPPPRSWYPGHMSKFARQLPALLARTDVVLELRDARLPLTSVHPALEGAIETWQAARRRTCAGPGALCERIVVLGKTDLVAQWGIPPFRRAMQRHFPGLRLHFASRAHAGSVRALRDTLVGMAKAPEVNVLVVGMPNVGKSTLLNALRTCGIPGPTPKALRTSAHPGLTRALSTRLKLSLDPPIYAYDSPGVMLPFLGRDARGAERGAKLALIAGIREGMYDVEALAAYLVYRLWVLNPSAPAYMALLAPGAPPPGDAHELLDGLAARLGMLRRGGARDVRRAAVWLVHWWRAAQFECRGGAADAGWGFDFEWEGRADVQARMEERIAAHVREVEAERRGGGGVSATQGKKRAREAQAARRRARGRARR